MSIQINDYRLLISNNLQGYPCGQCFTMAESIGNTWKGPQLDLISIPTSVLNLLQNGDFHGASKALASLKFPTEFVTSPSCTSTWRYRFKQLQREPQDADWITRLVIKKDSQEVIGRAGFHGRPDSKGMVEIGYEIDPSFRRRGYGSAAVDILMKVARDDARVTTIRASVGIGNAISRQMILKQGFTKVGQEMDEEDGLEDVFEIHLRPPVGETNYC